MSAHPPPEFHPSPETELLCQDVHRDANGRVFAHLLRQVDVAHQQNAFIIREQMAAADGRDKILGVVNAHAANLAAHAASDDMRFAALQVAQREFSEWRKTWFGRKGIGAIVLSALVFVSYDAIIKPFIAKLREPAKTTQP